MKRFLRFGCLAGLAAGVVSAVFAGTVGRAPLRDAIALEEGHSHSSGGAHHEDLFGRGVQEVGGAVGLVVFGLALGVIFSVVLAAVGSRLGASTPLGASLRLGLAGFVSVVLVPFLKYPANPPAAGDPETVNERTLLYFAVLALSISLTWVVWHLYRSVGWEQTVRAWAATALYCIGVALLFVALPGNPDTVDVPVDIVWRFRLASLGVLASAWTVLALAMGTMLSRTSRPDARVQ